MARGLSPVVIVAGVALAAVAVWMLTSTAAADPALAWADGEGDQSPDAGGDGPASQPPTDIPLAQIPDIPGPVYDIGAPLISTGLDVMPAFNAAPLDARVRAVLYAIRCCEHRAADVASGACYTTFYGGQRFSNMLDHPVITGELKPVPLDNLGPRYAGKVSSAAGAYQFIVPTWQGLRQAGSWGGYLATFDPPSQDEAARRLLIQCGAMSLIEAGDLDGAMARASSQWASLPGSSAGQGGRSLDFVHDAVASALAA